MTDDPWGNAAPLSNPALDFLIQVQAASHGRWWSMTAEEQLWFTLGVAAEHIAHLRREATHLPHSWADKVEAEPAE